MPLPPSQIADFSMWWFDHLQQKFHKNNLLPGCGSASGWLWMRVSTNNITVSSNDAGGSNRNVDPFDQVGGSSSSKGWPPVSAIFTPRAKNIARARQDCEIWSNGASSVHDKNCSRDTKDNNGVGEVDVVRVPHDSRALVSGGEDWHEYLLQALQKCCKEKDAVQTCYHFQNARVIPIGYQDAYIIFPHMRPPNSFENNRQYRIPKGWTKKT